MRWRVSTRRQAPARFGAAFAACATEGAMRRMRLTAVKTFIDASPACVVGKSLSLLRRAVSRIHPLRCSTQIAQYLFNRRVRAFLVGAIAAPHLLLRPDSFGAAFAINWVGADGHIRMGRRH